MKRAHWVRLGRVVRARREELRRTQRSMAHDVQAPAAMWRGLEAGTPSSYPGELIVAVERALRWRSGSVEAVLGGGVPSVMTVDEVRAAVRAEYDRVMVMLP